jgi:glutamyl-tRNA synthetase/glutamyl-Q tRNA(Asp) synthetase
MIDAVAVAYGTGPGPRPDLDALVRRLPSRPVTRFAPAPTGDLHLGHLVNAIYVWGIARAIGARVLLRIEDHDRTRARAAFEHSILRDLEWLGLEPDLASPGTASAWSNPRRQSDETHRYVAALDRLRATTHVYACDCSRRDIAQRAGDVAGCETPYPGRCRTRGLADAPGCGLRLQLAPGGETFDDARLGAQVQDPSAQCGDLLLRDRLGHWTYQFAVTVDDFDQGVDLVIRGEDLLTSTGRQLRLARLLGRQAPAVYLHHGLVRCAGGRKLSKSSGDTGVRQLGAQGATPADLLGLAARLCGLAPEGTRIDAPDLAGLFDGRARHDGTRAPAYVRG